MPAMSPVHIFTWSHEWCTLYRLCCRMDTYTCTCLLQTWSDSAGIGNSILVHNVCVCVCVCVCVLGMNGIKGQGGKYFKKGRWKFKCGKAFVSVTQYTVSYASRKTYLVPPHRPAPHHTTHQHPFSCAHAPTHRPAFPLKASSVVLVIRGVP